MSRSGQNPMKWLPVDGEPSRVTMTTIVHIPMLEGYWRYSLEVLERFFASLVANTEIPYDLFVFDNGSCLEVQDYLLAKRRSGVIHTLILSRENLRKIGALEVLLKIAPGEIISFADSDVLFLPGWLDATLEVLDAFPEAGQVTALPTADTARRHCENTRKAVEQATDLQVSHGPELIPERYVEAHQISLGVSPEEYAGRLQGRNDTLLIRGGVKAFLSAQDFQFTTRRSVLDKVLPLTLEDQGDYYDPVYSPILEAKVDRQGYWRLSTADYKIHHLGNTQPDPAQLPAWLRPELERLDLSTTAETSGREPVKRLQNRYLRRLAKRLNLYTYKLLYGR